MKHKALVFFLLLLTAGCILLASCGTPNSPGNSTDPATSATDPVTSATDPVTSATDPVTSAPDDRLTANLTFADATFTYDKTVKSLSVAGLPEGSIVNYTGNDQKNAGTYTVTASITLPANYKPVEDMTATLTINKAEYDVSGIVFKDTEFIFDGSTHKLLATGIPEDLEPKYDNNRRSKLGEQTATLSFKFTNDEAENNYNLPTPMTAILKVVAGEDQTVAQPTMTDATYLYDGANHALAVVGELPAGTSIGYTYNGVLSSNGVANAGEYEVKATITLPIGYTMENNVLTATLTINKATLDISGVTFTDKTVDYDGNEQTVEVTGLTEELSELLTVVYTDNKTTLPAVLQATATLTFKDPVMAGNYNFDPATNATLSATLTVDAAGKTVIIPTLSDLTVDYDGTEKSLAVAFPEGTSMPGGTQIRYDGNAQINAGVYTVTATITPPTGYIMPKTLTATLTINKVDFALGDLAFNDMTVTYDEREKTLEVTGLPDELDVSYTANTLTNAGALEVTASFTFKDATDANNYNPVADMTATLTINPAVVSGIGQWNYTNAFPYIAGTSYTVELVGLPSYVTAVYANNVQEAAGDYTATATLTCTDPNYTLADTELTLDWVITQKTIIDLSGLTFDDVTEEYTGTAFTRPSIVGELPTGITAVTYRVEKDGVLYEGEILNAGIYRVVATFTLADAEEYAPVGDWSILFTVAPKVLDMSQVTWVSEEDNRFEYDGNKKTVTVTGLPTDTVVTVVYTGNEATAIGEYTATATFSCADANYTVGTVTELTLNWYITRGYSDIQ